jgi:hypothetical protein
LDDVITSTIDGDGTDSEGAHGVARPAFVAQTASRRSGGGSQTTD